MSRNSDVLDLYDISNTTFPPEIMNWYCKNDKDTIIVIWNEDNEIIYASNLVQEYFDVSRSELIGKEWTSFFPEEQVEHIIKHFAGKDAKLRIQNIAIPAPKKGKTYTFNGIIDRIIVKEQLFHICKLQNVTYLNELKQILLDSEKLIRAGQLSAGLVHEIRNPLTSLKGFLQLVQAGVEQKEEYYKVMIGEIDKLEKITSELLQMAKPFKGKKKTEHVSKMIDDVLFIMSTQSAMKNIHFTIDLDDNLTTNCNAAQIKQVLINIIKNGAEAMHNEGNINIQTRLQNDYIAISITDEGEGMPDEFVEQLNNPFFTTKQGGTGLGLVITQHILEIHHGELKVETEENKGTTFTILLPFA